MPDQRLRRIADLLQRMQELTEVLVDSNIHALTVDKRQKIEIALANLLSVVDWFEWANGLEVDPQRVEAEFDRYDEESEETTQRQDPMI